MINLFGNQNWRLVCIADKQSLRWKAFESAVEEFSESENRPVQIDLVNWQELIQADGTIDSLSSFDVSSFENSPALLRIESPARDFEITRLLLAAGARETGDPADLGWSDVPFEKGKLVEPRLVFLGLKRTLLGLGKSIEKIEGLHPLVDPTDVLSMFNKNVTSRQLSQAEIPTPEFDDWQASESAWSQKEGPDEFARDLVRQMQELNRKSVYVKLACGSSSSGMVYLEGDSDSDSGSVRVRSTMAMTSGNFYNAQVHGEIDDRGIGERLSYLFQQGATLQVGIDKAKVGGENFDLRVVVVDGQVAATIFRVSEHPFTNLFLGGHRGDWKRCRSMISDRIWLDAMDDCVRAAELYRSHVVGVDLVFDRDCVKYYIIELNPFGDFFPGWENEQGESIYQVELNSMFRSSG